MSGGLDVRELLATDPIAEGCGVTHNENREVVDLISDYLNLRYADNTSFRYAQSYRRLRQQLNELDEQKLRCMYFYIQLLKEKTELQKSKLAAFLKDLSIAPAIKRFVFSQCDGKITDPTNLRNVLQMFLIDNNKTLLGDEKKLYQPVDRKRETVVSSLETLQLPEICEIIQQHMRLNEAAAVFELAPARFIDGMFSVDVMVVPVVASDGKTYDYETLRQVYTTPELQNRKPDVDPLVYVNKDLRGDMRKWLTDNHFTDFLQFWDADAQRALIVPGTIVHGYDAKLRLNPETWADEDISQKVQTILAREGIEGLPELPGTSEAARGGARALPRPQPQAQAQPQAQSLARRPLPSTAAIAGGKRPVPPSLIEGAPPAAPMQHTAMVARPPMEVAPQPQPQPQSQLQPFAGVSMTDIAVMAGRTRAPLSGVAAPAAALPPAPARPALPGAPAPLALPSAATGMEMVPSHAQGPPAKRMRPTPSAALMPPAEASPAELPAPPHRMALPAPQPQSQPQSQPTQPSGEMGGAIVPVGTAVARLRQQFSRKK